MEEQKTLDKMTIEELKALAYDQIVLLNQTQQNINLIQQELNKRRQNDKS